MSSAFTESIVEDAALGWLESLGYATVDAPISASFMKRKRKISIRMINLKPEWRGIHVDLVALVAQFWRRNRRQPSSDPGLPTEARRDPASDGWLAALDDFRNWLIREAA